MSSNSNDNQNIESNPLLHWYKEWILRTPFITRNSMVMILLVYLSSFIFDFTIYLANVPYLTIQYFQLYRLILSPLVGNSIFSIIMIMLFYPVMGGKIELMLGSTIYLYLIAFITIATNLAYIAICYLLWFLGGIYSALGWDCSGFWLIIFGLITIECMQDPTASKRMMFIPIDIPSVYFPLALYAFFFLLGGVDMGSLLSIGLGYAYGYGYIPSSMMLSNAYAMQVLEGSSSSGSGGILGSGNSMRNSTPTQCWLRCTRCLEGFVASTIIARMSPYPGYIMAGAATGSGESLTTASASVSSQPAQSRQTVGNRLSDGNPNSSPMSGGSGLFSIISSYFGGGSNNSSDSATTANRSGAGFGSEDGELRHSVPNGGFSDLFNTRSGGDNLGRYAPVARTNEADTDPDVEEGVGSETGSGFSGQTNAQTASRPVRSARDDRELIAAKRMAALGGGMSAAPVAPVAFAIELANRPSNSTVAPSAPLNAKESTYPSAPPVPSSNPAQPPTCAPIDIDIHSADYRLNMQMLGDMGFNDVEASEALKKSGNDLNKAINMLT